MSSAEEMSLYPPTRWPLRVAQVLLGVLTPLLLLSLGGAGIAAAPVLLPALWLVARESHSVARGYFVLLAALDAGEAIWAATWDLGPVFTWVPPAVVGAVLVVFPFSFRRVKEARHVWLTLFVLVAIGLVGALQMVEGSTTASETKVESRRVRTER